MLGYPEEEIDSSPNTWIDRVHPEDSQQLNIAIAAHLRSNQPHFECEHRMLHKDGTYRWMLTRGLAVRDSSGKLLRMAGSQSDITKRKQAEERLIHNAFYDILTGLPNRALLIDRLGQAVSRWNRWPDKSYFVLFLDLDQFKFINDSLGHEIGDQILVAVASKIQATLRNTDTVARYGGDEFIILIEDIQEAEGVKEVTQRIMKSLSTPICINGQEIVITASIGIVSGDIGYEDPEQLLRDADIAMYSAKSQGRDRYETFKLEMRNDFLDQLSLEYDLKHAVKEGELQLVYQPIISLKTGELAGFEALVRWEHPTKGLLYPGDFIKLAEDRGLILPIDRWVLQNASQKIRDWLVEFPSHSDLTMSVNLSAKCLKQLNLVEEVEAVLKDIGLEGKHLKLEITESGVMENSQQIRAILNGLRSLGVDIHIDDFGTGYSSLAYLHQFPIQALKIDRSFVSHLDTREHMPGFVRTVLNLAHELGLTVIAEGVENQEQVEQLQGLGCEFGQGYYYSRPLGEEGALMVLQTTRAGQNLLAMREADL
jgi:diguanylate cyclase (GGDEF)-like protein/PAS domain S-box-containing protein